MSKPVKSPKYLYLVKAGYLWSIFCHIFVKVTAEGAQILQFNPAMPTFVLANQGNKSSQESLDILAAFHKYFDHILCP